MKKIKIQPSFLQVLYLLITLILFSVILLTPVLIKGPLHLTEKLILEEEIIEGFLLSVLVLLSILIYTLYTHESAKQKELINKINLAKKSAEEKLFDSFQYIGQINVQIEQIKLIFNNSDKLPGTKNDFKKTLYFLSERIFGITKADWILFKIIDIKNSKTINEQFETRHGYTFDYPHVSNKTIIENQSCPPFTAIISNQQNFNFLVCCILSVDNISKDERVFIQAITNEITMLFVILNSLYYTEGNKIAE
ncbi:MAG: hypothetical protein WAL94_08760 [Bacteroidales bacterium]|jgi:hypothetical protein